MAGFTTQVNRVEAIRLLAEAMRHKTEQWEIAKVKYAVDFAAAREEAVQQLQDATIALAKAETEDEKKLVSIPSITSGYGSKFPSVPTLNVCQEKTLLNQLKVDKREVITLPDSHLFWTLVNPKCETIWPTLRVK